MPATTALLLGTQQRPPGRALLALPPPQRPVAAAGPVALSTRPPAGRLTAAAPTRCRLGPAASTALGAQSDDSPGCLEQAPPVQPAAAAAADREGDSPELHAAKRELLFSIVILVAIALVLHFRLGWIVAEGLPAPTKKAWRDVVVANLAGPLQRLFAAWRVGPQEAAAAEVFAAAVAKGLAADWPRKTVFAFLATTGSAAALLGLKAYNTCLTEMYRAGKRRSWLEAAAAFLWKAAAFLWESAGTFFWEVLARRRGAGADGGGTGAASSGEGGATAASGNGRGEV